MSHCNEAPQGGRFQMFPAGDVNLRVFTRDLDRSGLPLLICNGLGQSIEILYPLLEELPVRPIIAIDAAGTGKSDIPKGMTTIPQHSAMQCDVLDQLGVNRVDVLGISWGGAVAQQIARDRPDRVRKLVLAITSAGGIGSWWGSPIAMSEIMFPWRYVNKAYGNFIGPLMYGGEAVTQPALFREYSRLAIRPTYKGYIAQVQAMCSWTSLPWLDELTMPTQIIGGNLDTLIPITNQMMLASLIPNARLRTFNAGHLLMYSRRSEVGALMTDFLDG